MRCGRSATLRSQKLGCDEHENLRIGWGRSCSNEVERGWKQGERDEGLTRVGGLEVRKNGPELGWDVGNVTWSAFQIARSSAQSSEIFTTVEMVYGARFEASYSSTPGNVGYSATDQSTTQIVNQKLMQATFDYYRPCLPVSCTDNQ